MLTCQLRLQSEKPFLAIVWHGPEYCTLKGTACNTTGALYSDCSAQSYFYRSSVRVKVKLRRKAFYGTGLICSMVIVNGVRWK